MVHTHRYIYIHIYTYIHIHIYESNLAYYEARSHVLNPYRIAASFLAFKREDLPPQYPTTPYKGVTEVMGALKKAKKDLGIWASKLSV